MTGEGGVRERLGNGEEEKEKLDGKMAGREGGWWKWI